MSHENGLSHPLNLKFTAHLWLGPAILMIAGALQTLTFSPFHIWALGPVSVLLILLVTLNLPSEKLFRAGWFVGLGLFAFAGTGKFNERTVIKFFYPFLFNCLDKLIFFLNLMDCFSLFSFLDNHIKQ